MSPRIQLTNIHQNLTDQDSRLDSNAPNANKVDTYNHTITYATYKNNHTYIMEAHRRDKIEDPNHQSY